MAQLIFNIHHQIILRADTFKVVSDSRNYLRAEFKFLTADWSGKTATAIFRNSTDAYEVALDQDNTCLVPWEVLQKDAGNFEVSVFAGDLITANVAKVKVYKSGYSDDLESGTEPTPSVYSQIVERLTGVEQLQVEAETLPPGSTASVSRSTDPETGGYVLHFGVPKGEKGDEQKKRVFSLDGTDLAESMIVEALGNPVYVSDVSEYAEWEIAETGWYVFARIVSKDGSRVTAGTTVEGAAGIIASIGNNYVDVAVKFEVAAMSRMICINWDTYTDRIVFKATDLAVRNLDYRVTFYVYDIDEFATWEYVLTSDTKFTDGKYYYTKGDDDTYTLAEVTVGDTIPSDTYYVHSKVTFEGMARNITYRCNTIIDCPVVFILPEIEDETHGCWFEIRFQHAGSYSSTLQVPEGVKVATEHTQAETKGMNMVDLHYTVVGDTKLWRFMNTHSSIPA